MTRKRKAKRSNDIVPSGIGLRRVNLLEGISADALAALAHDCVWRQFVADHRIISRQATDRDVYMIVSGRVRVTAFAASGREVTFRDLAAGEIFGDLAAIDGRARSADIVALEDSLVASMSPEIFRQLIRDHPMVCDRVLLRLVHSVRELSDRVFDLSTLGVQNRVHAEVLRLAREAGVHGNRARIDPAPRHAEIASKISSYREQVTREISVMSKSGLIRRDGRALVVPDVAQLEQIVAEVRRLA